MKSEIEKGDARQVALSSERQGKKADEKKGGAERPSDTTSSRRRRPTRGWSRRAARTSRRPGEPRNKDVLAKVASHVTPRVYQNGARRSADDPRPGAFPPRRRRELDEGARRLRATADDLSGYRGQKVSGSAIVKASGRCSASRRSAGRNLRRRVQLIFQSSTRTRAIF